MRRPLTTPTSRSSGSDHAIPQVACGDMIFGTHSQDRERVRRPWASRNNAAGEHAAAVRPAWLFRGDQPAPPRSGSMIGLRLSRLHGWSFRHPQGSCSRASGHWPAPVCCDGRGGAVRTAGAAGQNTITGLIVELGGQLQPGVVLVHRHDRGATGDPARHDRRGADGARAVHRDEFSTPSTCCCSCSVSCAGCGAGAIPLHGATARVGGSS